MDLSVSHYAQLIIAMILGIGLFAAAYLVPERLIVGLLVCLIPFQPITSIYGTLNEGFVYMVGAAFLLKGRITVFPLLGSVLFIIFAYLLSFTQIPRAVYFDNILYLIAIGANFILFYLVFNFVLRQRDWRFIWNVLLTLNVLVIGYCLLQLIVGFGELQLFGISEFAINANRDRDQRLTGPFMATAMTAEYFDIQILILGYALLRKTKKSKRSLLLALISLNTAFLIATGNRGGIATLIIGGILFLYMFRREIGIQKALKIGIAFTLVLTITSVIMIRFTEFNSLYERIEGTEFEGMIPDTRQGWISIWPSIIEEPLVGHGPRLRLMNEEERRIRGYVPIPYPHNLYMYLMYTIGSVGLLAYAILFLRIAARFSRSKPASSSDKFLDGLPRLGLIILAMFAVSEFRMEMLRFLLHDYQQYIFMLLGAFLAFTELVRRNEGEQKSAEGAKSGQIILSRTSPKLLKKQKLADRTLAPVRTFPREH